MGNAPSDGKGILSSESSKKIKKRGSKSAVTAEALSRKPGAAEEELPGAKTVDENALGGDPQQQHQLRPANPLSDKVMHDFIQKTITQGLKGIREEWHQVAGTFPKNSAATLYEYNHQRNFPGGSPCLDHTRVQLALDVPPQTEYIHANWVATTQCDLPKLIITQAPQDATVNDFWRMIYQEKCRVIVMLCDKYENGKRIVAQYWPQRASETTMYGQIRVQNNGIVTPEGETSYVKYQLTVSYRSEPAITTMLYANKTWKEGFVPESTFAFLRLVRCVMKEPSTLCIHGAAGAGRPGVMVAVMIALKAIANGRPINIPYISSEIREQRMGAITCEIQYVYIYRILCEYIQRKGIMKDEIAQMVHKFNLYKKEYIAIFFNQQPKTVNKSIAPKV